jgi:hypothetical protein
MLIGLALVACVLSVPLLGGRLGAIAELRFAAVPAVVIAIGLQVVIITLIPGGSPALHQVAHVVSYCCAGWFVWANRRLPGLALIAAGGACNLLAIAANGGVMPASAGALRAAGRTGHDDAFLNSAAVAHPHLQFLGDVFPTPAALPFANVFSVGDVLLVAGAFVLLLSAGRAGRREAAAESYGS